MDLVHARFVSISGGFFVGLVTCGGEGGGSDLGRARLMRLWVW